MSYCVSDFNSVNKLIGDILGPNYAFEWGNMEDCNGYMVEVYQKNMFTPISIHRIWGRRMFDITSNSKLTAIIKRISGMVRVIKATEFKHKMNGRLPQ